MVKSLHCLCCPSCNLLFQTKCGYSCRKQGKAEQYWTQERRPRDGRLAFIDWEGGSLFPIAFCHRSSGLPQQELTNLIQAGRDWLRCGCSWKPWRPRRRASPRHAAAAAWAPLAFPLRLPSSPAHSSHLGGLLHPTTSWSAVDKSFASGAKLLPEQFWHPIGSFK